MIRKRIRHHARRIAKQVVVVAITPPLAVAFCIIALLAMRQEASDNYRGST